MEPSICKSHALQQQQQQQQKHAPTPPVARRRSRYDHYTTVVMRRFSNPFKLRKSSGCGDTGEDVVVKVQDSASSKSPSVKSLDVRLVENSQLGATDLSSTELAFELEQIQAHVEITSTRIRHLQDLIDHEEPTISRVTELKRQLKDTHRELEKLYFQVRGDHGDETADPVRDVVRGVWQAYRGMVKLEEKLRSGQSAASSPVIRPTEERRSPPETKIPEMVEQAQGVYIPTGARDSKKADISVLKPHKEIEEQGQGDIIMTGALRLTDEQRRAVRDSSSEALSILEASSPPSVNECKTSYNALRDSYSYRDSHGSAYDTAPLGDSHPEQWPQPRRTVIMRVQREEANSALTLRTPDRVRKGSCNGYMITDMIMCGVDDHRFVLPYLHHIKHHEIRVLKRWLVEEGHIQTSGLISCTEKVLHCLQLLQTGNRYETISVLFSRSPRQIQESCHEVMAGLMELYNATVDGDCEHEVYAPLWYICKKFVLNAQKAETYYGFRWMDLVQVLVALNLYIGRSRGSPSPFEGQPFDWAKFLLAEPATQLRHTSPRVREIRDSSEESDSDSGSDDLSIYDTPVLRVVPFLSERT